VYFSQTTQANPHREIEEVHSTGQKLPLRFDSKLHVVEYHQRTSRAPSANSQGWDLHISPARLSATSTTSNPVSHRDPRGPNRVNIVDKSEGSVGYTIHVGIPVHKARSVWLRSALSMHVSCCVACQCASRKLVSSISIPHPGAELYPRPHLPISSVELRPRQKNTVWCSASVHGP
jgi:hypothetical protein